MSNNKKILFGLVVLLLILGSISFKYSSYTIYQTIELPNSTFSYEEAKFWGIPVSNNMESEQQHFNEKDLSITTDNYSFWGIPKELIKYANSEY